jgi:hypothetical protein
MSGSACLGSKFDFVEGPQAVVNVQNRTIGVSWMDGLHNPLDAFSYKRGLGYQPCSRNIVQNTILAVKSTVHGYEAVSL